MNRERDGHSLIAIQQSRWRVDYAGALAAGLLVVLFSALLLWHDRLIFWNDDYEISILPVFADVARSWNEGHLPLLSPYSWVCSNLAGEFQYGTFSIFVNAAVVLIWKLPLTFPQQAAALSISHLCVLAAGAFLLGRGRGLSRALSMLVAIVSTLSGWIVCWGATDWFGALGAFAWLPWCWWALERSLSYARPGLEGGAPATPGSAAKTASRELAPPPRRYLLRAILLPAPFVYLLVAGGFPYTVVMLGVLVAWLCLREVVQTHNWRPVIPALIGVVLGFGLSAPAWLALLDYVHGSNRSAQSSVAHWQWLVPPAALPGFILPSWTVNWADFSTRYLPHGATELACGLVPPAALLWGLIFRGRAFVRQIRWELGLLVIVIVLSMLPSAGVFRWSFRWLPFLQMIMVLCAAEALRPDAGRVKPVILRRVSVFALLLVALTISGSYVFDAQGHYAGPVAICATLMALGWIGADFSTGAFREWAPAAVAFGVLLSTYLVIPPNCGVPKYNFTEDLTNPQPLARDRLYLAVYSPEEYVYRREYKQGPVGQVARPGSTSMWAGLRFINGYSPILAAGVARDFEFFIHGEIDADMGRQLVLDQAGPGGILDQLGVDGLVIAREMEIAPTPAEWQLDFENDEGSVFHRRSAPFGLLRSVSRIETHPGEEFAMASVAKIRDRRNALEFDVNVPDEGRPALLTVFRPFFPGYKARLGERELRVGSYKGLMPTIEVPAGAEGHLVLSYRPWWLVIGGTVSICCLLLIVVCVSFLFVRPKTWVPST